MTEKILRQTDDEMREFLFVVRRALLLVVRWIEVRYGWSPSKGGDD